MVFILANSALNNTPSFSFIPHPTLFPELHEFIFYSWCGCAWYACLCSAAINTTLVKPPRESTQGFTLGKQHSSWSAVMWVMSFYSHHYGSETSWEQSYFDRSRHETIAFTWQFFCCVTEIHQSNQNLLRKSIRKLEIGSLCLFESLILLFISSSPQSMWRQRSRPFFSNVVTLYAVTVFLILWECLVALGLNSGEMNTMFSIPGHLLFCQSHTFTEK